MAPRRSLPDICDLPFLSLPQAAAALTNLSRKKRSNMIAIAEAGGIPPLVKLLWQGPNSEAAMLSLSALTNLAYTSCNRCGGALRRGFGQRSTFTAVGNVGV